MNEYDTKWLADLDRRITEEQAKVEEIREKLVDLATDGLGTWAEADVRQQVTGLLTDYGIALSNISDLAGQHQSAEEDIARMESLTSMNERETF